MFKEPISCVTVCIGYGDFLAETLKYNRHHFDKFVVVTSNDDVQTREVCRQHKATCLVTEDHKRDGEFSKGRLVERGLQHLPADGWILHMDSDIVLPYSFRSALEVAHLNAECIYGCDRFMVKSWESWQKVVASGWLTGKFYGHPHALLPPPNFEIGARWIGSDGYVPIGFLQLWNRVESEEEWRGTRAKSYPLYHGNSCRTDVQFSHLFDRRERVLLPELFVAHLESQPCPTGANWKGRKTKPFGPASLDNKNENTQFTIKNDQALPS